MLKEMQLTSSYLTQSWLRVLIK